MSTAIRGGAGFLNQALTTAWSPPKPQGNSELKKKKKNPPPSSEEPFPSWGTPRLQAWDVSRQYSFGLDWTSP